MLKKDPRLPDWAFDSIADIDFEMLHSLGIEYYFVDLDGTLVGFPFSELHQSSITALKAAQDNGLVKDVLILSNVGIRLFFLGRLQKIATFLGFKYLGCHKPNAMKPETPAFHRALILAPGATVNNSVMIGDQMNTDMVGGNTIGMWTILVRSIPPILPWKWWKFRKQARLLEAEGIEFVKRITA